jgi:hypothetical protein
MDKRPEVLPKQSSLQPAGSANGQKVLTETAFEGCKYKIPVV